MPSLDSLTPDKYQNIILGLTAERTIVVKGVAGSGKSLTLLKKAKQVSTYSESYAIIVYTKSLKQFFVEELAEIGQTEGHVYYFEEWQRSDKPHFTYMFVDECQDFNAEEIDDFKHHGTYCWFFGDTTQSIMEFRPTNDTPGHNVQSVEETARKIGVQPQKLVINHRLTIENAKVGEHIKPETRLSETCYKHGPKPLLIHSTNPHNQLDTIIERISSNNITNAGILAYYNDEVIAIRDYFAQRGIPVQWKTNDGMEIDFQSTNPIVINWHCAKGLEFPYIFIPFCGYGDYATFTNVLFNDPVISEISALFVATTRPLEQMFLLYTGTLCRDLPPATSDIYANPQLQNIQPILQIPQTPDDLPF